MNAGRLNGAVRGVEDARPGAGVAIHVHEREAKGHGWSIARDLGAPRHGARAGRRDPRAPFRRRVECRGHRPSRESDMADETPNTPAPPPAPSPAAAGEPSREGAHRRGQSARRGAGRRSAPPLAHARRGSRGQNSGPGAGQVQTSARRFAKPRRCAGRSAAAPADPRVWHADAGSRVHMRRHRGRQPRAKILGGLGLYATPLRGVLAG